MNKIDLHVHTKSIKGYDDNKRDVTDKQFYDAVKDAGVKYIAITNHNSFDLEQYQRLVNKCSDILIFPGIELDIFLSEEEKNSGEYHNINLVFNPSCDKKLSDIVKGWDIEKKKCAVDDVINVFDEMKPIYLCDHKTKPRRFSKDQIKSLQRRTKNPVIADVNNDRSKIVLGFNEITSLLGSDNKDWDNYAKNASKLGEITWDIHNFDELYRLLKFDDDTTIKSLMKRKEFTDYDINIDKDTFSIRIIKGLNIVFGGKGTGKSKIISSIKEQLGEENPTVSYYKASEKETDFKNKFPKKFDIEPEIKSIFANTIGPDLNIIKRYPKNDYEKLALPSDYYTPLNNERGLKYKIAEAPVENVSKPGSLQIYKKFLNMASSLSNYYDSNYEELKFLTDEKTKAQKLLFEVKNKICEEYLKVYKKYYKNKNIENFVTATKESVLIDNGVDTCPTHLGLFELWKCRMNFKKSCEKVLEYKNIESSVTKGTIATVPDKGEIQYVQIVKPYINKDDGYDKYGECTPNQLGQVTTMLEGISSGNTICPNKQSIDDLVDKLSEISINAESFIAYKGDIFKVKDNGEPDLSNSVEISDGEKSSLLLATKLDTSYKFVLLDEPSTYLGGELVSKSIIPKIRELKQAGTTVIIATHDANLAINSLPINMIYRKYTGDDKYQTYSGNWWEQKFINDKDFSKVVTDNFEGGMDAFNVRKEIYSNDFED